MTLPTNPMFKIYGDTTDNAALPIFTNSDAAGDYGAGILVDIDFADPEGAGGYQGAFTNGDLIANSAAEHVIRRLIPSASVADLAMTIAGNRTAQQIAIERTGKGYPHIVSSKTANPSGTFRLNFGLPIRQYMLDFPNNVIVASFEEYITDISTQTSNPGDGELFMQNGATYSANYLFRFDGRNGGTGGALGKGSSTGSGTRVVDPDNGSTTGHHFKAVSASGANAPLPTAASMDAGWVWGATAGGANATYRSSIALRMIVEDLTVSAAALAAAKAAGIITDELQDPAGSIARRRAIWNMRKLSADYYSGDTFTAPGTLLA